MRTLGNDVDALINAATAAEQFFQNGATLQESTQETVNLYSFNVDNTTHAGPQCQFPIDKLLDSSHGGVGLTGTCQTITPSLPFTAHMVLQPLPPQAAVYSKFLLWVHGLK